MAKIGLPALLKTMVDQGASDLHITPGVPPLFRINGKMVKAKLDPLGPPDTKEICYSVLTDTQKAEFEKHLEIDFSFGIKELSRFRGNIFYQRGGTAAVFRRIPMTIPDFDSLHLPQVLKKIVHRPNGLILVTGPTGSGKSTSLASMLDVLNREEYGHILTIEDPIEFVHPHKNCIVNQREVGVDTKTFGSALKRVLRQDPDFVLVGELRDVETIEMALTLAETGHLVFATLHTNSAVQSINRIINVFPPHQQIQIRQLLSFTLQAIMSQQLIPRSFEPGRAMACEVLIPTLGIRNLIREDKIHQIYGAMQAGQDETGMQTMNQALLDLVNRNILSKADAVENSTSPDELAKLLGVTAPKGK
ncbi:MAG: type IV pili twitching motility protein PilT [Bdellovibrionales bacterium GWB1_55_8]|nr:MAG: type IV pili twitching motility protein PilT [Bdellovibrionales bacterium GWB1_55_8]